MRKAPYRPNNEITQAYNDGVVRIYRVSDAGNPGYKPVEKPEFKAKLAYAERRTGVTRYYAAMQAQVEIERLLRVPRSTDMVNPQDLAVTEDGRQYTIGQVQTAEGVFPPSLDLTLTKVTHLYEVQHESNP